MNRYITLPLIVISILTALATHAPAVESQRLTVTQYGVTWTLAKPPFDSAQDLRQDKQAARLHVRSGFIMFTACGLAACCSVGYSPFIPPTR